MVDLTTIRPGMHVATEHAPRFKGFLDDLEASGYGVDQRQSGGYNHRNIDGTNRLSNHAYGTAIDVNWTANPRGTRGTIQPDVARSLAAKHGLVWGGDWKNPDPMHFEVASASPVPMVQRGFTTYAGLGKPPPAPTQPGQSPMPAPMALGMTQPPSQPPSQDQVNLYAKRGLSMMPDWNRPIQHWTQALGNLAQQISGSMWLDKAEKGMGEQQAYVGDAMRRHNSPGLTAPPASGAASAAAAGFGPQGMTSPPPISNPALAPQKPKAAPDASQPQAAVPQSSPQPQQTATTPAPPATNAPAAPALSSQRPGFATAPDVLDTERERQQEAVLAEMMASGVPSAVEFAKTQLANINQKRLQFGLQAQQAQNQRQLAMTENAYKSLQTIDEQEAMGIISADQARMRRQSLAQYNPEIGRIVAQLPSMAAATAPSPPAPTSAMQPAAPVGLGSGASVINSGNPTPTAPQGALPIMGAPDNRTPFGAQAGSIMPNDSGLTMRLPELSPRALQLQKMIDYYASKGDGRSANVYESQLKQEPSYVARQKEAEKVGASNEAAEKSRKAGARALDVFDRMKANAEAWFEHAPKAAMGAIGPVQGTDEYQKWVNGLPLIGNAGAQNFHTRLMHDVDAIAVQLRAITGAGGQSNEFMDRTFKDAIGKAISSNDKESFFAILDSARNVILQASQLPPGYKPPTFNGQLTPEEVSAVNKFADPGKQIPAGGPMRVSGPEEASRLPSGTRFITPDGREMVKH